MSSGYFVGNGNTWAVAIDTTTTVQALGKQSLSPTSSYMVVNTSGNVAFVAFNAASAGNLVVPTAGNSVQATAVAPGETVFINPSFGTAQANVFVKTISSGTGTVYVRLGNLR